MNVSGRQRVSGLAGNVLSEDHGRSNGTPPGRHVSGIDQFRESTAKYPSTGDQLTGPCLAVQARTRPEFSVHTHV